MKLLLLLLFSRMLMLTLVSLGIIINLLPLYSPSYFVFCSFNYFCVFLCTRANFVIGLCAVKFASKQTRIELNYYYYYYYYYYFIIIRFSCLKKIMHNEVSHKLEVNTEYSADALE
jgi:hypothetical protein